jgi:hypothetical protein
MKASFLVRLFGCFIFSSLYALFVCVVNSSGMRVLISPILLVVFPSMVMGALFYSLIAGESYIFKTVGLSYRVLAIYIIAMGFVLFGLNPDMFHYNSIQVVLGSAFFGLALGYLMSDWHVYLYRAIYDKRLIGVSAGIFILSYYIIYNIFFPYGRAIVMLIDNTDFLFSYCCSCVVLLLAVIFVDLIFLRNENKSDGQSTGMIVIKDFSVIKIRLILVGLLSLQTLVLGMVSWGWFLTQSFSGSWLFMGNTQGIFQMIFIPSFVVFTILYMVLFTYVQDDLILYALQALTVVVSIFIFIGFMLGLRGGLFMDMFFMLLVFAGFGSVMLLHYYIIVGFKGSMISIFVPISISIYLFFTSIGQVILPIFPFIGEQLVSKLILIGVIVGVGTSICIAYHATFNMNMLGEVFRLFGTKGSNKEAKESSSIKPQNEKIGAEAYVAEEEMNDDFTGMELTSEEMLETEKARNKTNSDKE